MPPSNPDPGPVNATGPAAWRRSAAPPPPRPRPALLPDQTDGQPSFPSLAPFAPAPRRTGATAQRIDLPLPVDPLVDPPDPTLLHRYGAAEALRHNLLPWHRRNGQMLILTASPQDFDRRASFLAALYGPDLRPLPCPRPLIQSALLAHAGAELAAAAARRPAAIDSCRSFDRLAFSLACALLALVALALAALSPTALLLAVIGLSALSLAALTLLKTVTALATLRPAAPQPPPLPDDDLPTISLLIALYGEADIAPRLIRRLSALDYPRDRLETVILVEAHDTATHDALARADLPPWMRIITVPAGRIQTKPRALNFGLDFTRGTIIGIYDAEDAPAPDQLRKVAASFAEAPPRVACLQGALDFYNPRTNWIARCFTMEYAVWFRILLPGLERLGLPIPLGGTTLFLRRKVLAEIGAWDAHNVTEDADLGFRLARHGWQTRILPSTTLEEANCSPLPWIKQRSRWTKGYLMTWLVHMRHPVALWRDLGTCRYLSLQTLLLGSLLQVMLAPLQWSLLLWPPGPDHPLSQALPPAALQAMLALYIFAQLSGFGLTAMALRRAGHPPQWRWLPLTAPYFLLSSLAGLKALAEAATRPFHWDKTKHGAHDGDSGA